MTDIAIRLRPRANPTIDNPRTRRRRKLVHYREDSTDLSESGGAPDKEDDASPKQTPPSRNLRKSVKASYRENSEERHAHDGAPSEDELAAPTMNLRIRRSQPSTPFSKPSIQPKKRKAPSLNRTNHTIGPKRQKNDLRWKPRTTQETSQKRNIWNEKPMPWSTLPYHIWLSIFTYASYPLVSSTFDPCPTLNWLIRMAFVCKTFLEPVLTVLYHEPPIYSTKQIKGLADLLVSQKETSIINYRVKVKQISIDSMIPFAMRHEFLESVIPHVTQLQGIALGVHSDDPKLCRIHTRAPTAHLNKALSIYTILESSNTKLKSWTWNGTIESHVLPLSCLKDIHQTSPFQSLVSLTFVDFHLPEMVTHKGVQTRSEDALADALSALPSLRKLHFSLADIVNERLMPLLPDNLQTLVLTSCYNLFSPALTNFLHDKGQQIRELVLSHNQSLNLSFLTKLSEACPRLETLKMDLLYYNSHTTFNDSSPRYESLLNAGEQPSWPMSLRHLELFQLRKWKTPAAELFFSSFVDSPESLPDLRHIEIKASIDESSWRDRISFRDKWVRRLKETFLRKWVPPNPQLRSISAYHNWKSGRNSKSVQAESLPDEPDRRRAILASQDSVIPTAKDMSLSKDNDDSDAPLMKVRRSGRTQTHPVGIYNESDDQAENPNSSIRSPQDRGSLEDSSNNGLPLENDDADLLTRSRPATSKAAHYVQGLCSVVEVVIDNLRPAEEQLHESDFLDEEPSGDEDWNGDDDIDDGRYAW